MAETPPRSLLADECGLFCRYLLAREAPPEVEAAYLRAHELGSVGGDCDPTPLDRALLRLARAGPRATRAADAYAALFARSGLLRRKLVLVVALLESRGPSAAALDACVSRSRPQVALRITANGLAWTLRVALAGLLLAPLRLWYSLTAPRVARGAGGVRLE